MSDFVTPSKPSNGSHLTQNSQSPYSGLKSPTWLGPHCFSDFITYCLFHSLPQALWKSSCSLDTPDTFLCQSLCVCSSSFWDIVPLMSSWRTLLPSDLYSKDTPQKDLSCLRIATLIHLLILLIFSFVSMTFIFWHWCIRVFCCCCFCF